MGVTMRETEELRLVGHAAVAPHLLGPAGGVRTGALLTMLDNVGGLNGGLAALPDGWVVSTNLAARVVELAHVGPLRLDSGVLRRGRNNVVTERADPRRGRSATRSSRAVCSRPRSSCPRTVRRSGAVRSCSTRAVGRADRSARRSPTGSACGPSATTRSRSISTTELRNPWGILHGGVVATLVDLAAEHATGGGHTTDVVLHFLAPNRVGPVRAPRVLGHAPTATCYASRSATKAPPAPPRSRSSPRHRRRSEPSARRQPRTTARRTGTGHVTGKPAAARW